jgi:hypothetical protein
LGQRVSIPLHLPRARSLSIAIACAVACLLGSIAAADSHAAGWLPLAPALNGSGNAVAHPRVAVDDAGNVYAAWIEGSLLEVSKRPVGGAFETPQTLDPTPTTTIASNPDIAVDGTGNAVVVWTSVDGAGAHSIRQARRSAGASSFGAPVTLPAGSPSLQGLDNPRLAVNRAGTAVLAVPGTFNTDGIVRVFLATSTSDFSTASAATFHDYDEGGSTSVFTPDVAINEAGDAVVVWRVNSGSTLRIDAGYHAHGVAGFGSREAVNTGDVIGKNAPSVAIDSPGSAVATWDEDASTGGHLRAYARPAGAGVPWTKLNDIDAAQSGGATPHVAFDAGGTAVAAWSAGGELRDSTLATGGGAQFTQPPQSLTGGAEQPFDLALDAGSPGTIALTWAATSGKSGIVRAVVRPNGGVFGSIATLTPAGNGGRSTDVAVDPQGNAAAVWIDSSPPDSNTRIVTAEYDVTPPGLTAVSVPPTANAGTAVAMSASATDDWSTPIVSWDFGDGQTGTGTGVSHAYSSAGTYLVTTTATDGAGNTAVSTHTLIVSVVPLPLAPPTIGKTFNASTVRGTILVSTPKSGTGKLLLSGLEPVTSAISRPHGYTGFRILGPQAHIPIGSLLDATHGIVSVTMATKNSTATQIGQFSQGAFFTKQTKTSPLTSAEMTGGGNFKTQCPRPGAKLNLAAAARRPSRQLFANVHGRFRTRGRHSTATVRGTQYLVKESCRGTLTVVMRGRVLVHDIVKHRFRLVKAGHRYLARPF